MKKIAIAALLATGLAFTAFISPKTFSADNTPFEGVVTYSVSIDNPQAAAMMQNASGTVYIKGDKYKTVMDMGMQKITIIADEKSPDKPVMLIEVMGYKYQLKNDSSKKDDKSPDIKYSDDTKTIAGYVCHKADVTVTDKTGQTYTTTVYYTQEIPCFNDSKNNPFKGLKGFPMEYSMKQQGTTITFSATKVAKQSVPDDTFNVPSGYKLMTQAEMVQDIQKNMQSGN